MPEKPLFIMNPQETIEQLQDYYFPPYITLAHLFHAPSEWEIKKRLLKQYLLQYTVSGAAEYQIENRVYTAREGDLLLLRPNERHSKKIGQNEPYVCISVVFHFGNADFPFNDLVKNPIYVGNFVNHSINTKLSQLIVHYRQPGLIHQVQSQTLLMEILLLLHQWLRDRQPASARQNMTATSLLITKNYIADHYSEKVNLKVLEDISGLSGKYLIKQFKMTFGMSPIQYLTWIRLEKAKQLAVQTNLSIGEIANRVGYSDVHTFGKMFKKKIGINLSQFCATLFSDDREPKRPDDLRKSEY